MRVEKDGPISECFAEVLNLNARCFTQELRDFRQCHRSLLNTRGLLLLPPYTLHAELKTQLENHSIQFFSVCWHSNVPLSGLVLRVGCDAVDPGCKCVGRQTVKLIIFIATSNVNFSKFQSDLPDREGTPRFVGPREHAIVLFPDPTPLSE